MNTPRGMARLRHNGIIGAMLSGKISYREAMRLQEMESCIGLQMECSRLGIVVENGTETAQGCALIDRLVG